MTDPAGDAPEGEAGSTAQPPPPADPGPPGLDAPARSGAPTGPGLFRFAIGDRRAPGLFVAGWLASLIGGLVAFVGVLAGSTVAGGALFVVGVALLLVGLMLLGGSQAVERQAAGNPYGGPSPALVFGASIAALYLAVVIVVTPLGLAGVKIDGPALSLLGVAIQAIAVVVVIRVMVVGAGALSWQDMGVRIRIPDAVRDLAFGATYAIPVVFLTSLVVAGLVQLVGQSPESPLPPSGTSSGLVLNLLAGAVVAPAYEELLFRGFATTAWARVAGPSAAILRTSVLFALAHILTLSGPSFEAAAGLAIVAAGARLPVAFALGWVFLRRRSLWASIGLHATFNAILLILAEVAAGGGLA